MAKMYLGSNWLLKKCMRSQITFYSVLEDDRIKSVWDA